MQTIELFIKDESEDGVFAISLVDEPAIESDFLALSKQDNNKFNINLKEVDKKRKVVVGYASKGGEWVVMMSLTDEEYSKVEDGEYNGFSIEAMFQGFDALEQSKELTEDELIEKIKELLK